MGAKMQIMAWDAKRQMEIKMQKTIEALVMQKRQKALENLNGDASGITLLTQAELQQAPLLILKVRRNNLIEESLTQVYIPSLHFFFLFCYHGYSLFDINLTMHRQHSSHETKWISKNLSVSSSLARTALTREDCARSGFYFLSVSCLIRSLVCFIHTCLLAHVK